jgi:hypothetical protein
MAAPVIAALKYRKGKRLAKFLNDAEAAPEDYSAIRPSMALGYGHPRNCFHFGLAVFSRIRSRKNPRHGDLTNGALNLNPMARRARRTKQL